MKPGTERTGTLDVADDATGGVVHELDADLGDTSSGTCVCTRLVSKWPSYLLPARACSCSSCLAALRPNPQC